MDLPPDQFEARWTVGPRPDAAADNLLPPADGLEIFAARYQLPVTTEASP